MPKVHNVKAPQTLFSPVGVKRGFMFGQTLAVATFVYGMAFGLLSREVGLSVVEAALMSAVVYSASAQLAAVTIMSEASRWSEVSIWVIASTIFIVNARYLMYGATLHPWLKVANPYQAYSTLFVLGDGNWIASTRAHKSGEIDAGYILGSGLVMFIGWVCGTVVGSTTGALISNPELLGFDFLIVAFAAASGVAMFKGRTDISIVMVAAIAAFITSLNVGGGWPIIASGIAGAATAFIGQKFAGTAA